MPGRSDRGTGVVPTTVGFTAFVVGLLFAVQMLFGLHARTTVTAVASDVVHRAALRPVEAASLAAIEPEIRSRLGRYGSDVEVAVTLSDLDGDGAADSLSARVEAGLPTFGLAVVSAGTFTRVVTAPLDPPVVEP